MRILIIVLVVCFATRVCAQSVVAAGVCAGSASGGIFATSAGNCTVGGVPTITNPGDTLVIGVCINSGSAGIPTVTETAHSSTVNARPPQWQNASSPALILWTGDIVNAAAQTYTISAKSDNTAAKMRIAWADITGITATPFDQSGGVNINATASTTLLGATTGGALAQTTELAVEFACAPNNENSFGSPTNTNWAIPIGGTSSAGPSTVIADAVTNGTAAVVGTNFATLSSATQSLVSILTYIGSAQATPTATATATASGSPTASATATPTASPSCNPSSSPTPTATPTSTATPSCALPVVIAQATNVSIPTATASVTMTFGSSVVAGHLLAMNASIAGPASLIQGVSDNVNGDWRLTAPPCANPNGDIEDETWHFTGSGAGSVTVTVNFNPPSSGNIAFVDVGGIQTSAALDQVGTCNFSTDLTLSTGPITPAIVGDFVFGGISQVGTNIPTSILPGPPQFSAIAQAIAPLNVPLYLLQDNFLTAQASITVSGSAQDYAGVLVSFLACQQGGAGYDPPGY